MYNIILHTGDWIVHTGELYMVVLNRLLFQMLTLKVRYLALHSVIQKHVFLSIVMKASISSCSVAIV